MATIPTPEQNAREILSIFSRFNTRPNEVLPYRSFTTEWHDRGKRNEDFAVGMEYAAKMEWVEILRRGASFRLLQLGFDEAPESNSVNSNVSLQEKSANMNASPLSNNTKVVWPKLFETAFESYEATGNRLGEGGAGLVFQVKNGINETFALKCLSPERITIERRKRFKNEINFCSKYEHRNIIQIIDSGLSVVKNEKCPFYVMPEFPSTLRKLMGKGIPHEKILPLFSQILDGIDAAHKLKAFHRDLKPENILYDPSKDLAVIADFGIAHFEEDVIATAVETKHADRMANFSYAAPEQKTKGAKVDYRADIFALGLMLNEMFTGQIPHSVGYRTIASVAPDFLFLDALVEKMIQNNPTSRPESIDAVKNELISRGNSFVALQRLDSLTKSVVPQFEANKIEPIKILAADWDSERLILELNRTPEVGWTQRFRQPNGGSWESIMGSGPEFFQFKGNKAYVQADEGSAQRVVDYAKNYVEMANRGYQIDLNTKAKKEEQAYRENLRQEHAAAEARARVVSKLKV